MQFAVVLILFALISACADSRPAVPRVPAASLDSVPEGLRPSIRHLDSVLTPAEKVSLRNARPDGQPGYQFRLERLVRPEVHPWQGSFPAIRVWHLHHPEDLPGFALDAYGQYLRGEQIDVEATASRVGTPPPLDSFQVVRDPLRPAP